MDFDKHIQPVYPNDWSKDLFYLRKDGEVPDQYEFVRERLEMWYNDHLKFPDFDSIHDQKGAMRSSRFGFLAAMPVGTGKTAASLRLAYALRMMAEEEQWTYSFEEKTLNVWELPILVACDKSTKIQWVDSIAQWIPEWPFWNTVYVDGDNGAVKLQMVTFDAIKPKILIANYDKLADYNEEFRTRAPYLSLIIDEGRRVKHADTQRSQAVNAIPRLTTVTLDATPMTREPDSLWGVLQATMPGKYTFRNVAGESPKPSKKTCWLLHIDKAARARMSRYYNPEVDFNAYKKMGCGACRFFDSEDGINGRCGGNGTILTGNQPTKKYLHYSSKEWGTYEQFKYRYCQIDNSSGWEKVIGARNVEELRKRLFEDTGLMRRIDRKQIKGMPTVLDPEWIEVEMTPGQSRFYMQAEEGLIRYLNEEGEWGVKNVTNILAQISALRSFATIPPDVVLSYWQSGGKRPEWMDNVKVPSESNGGKQSWINEFIHLNLDDDDKLIVFSEFKRATDDLMSRLDSSEYLKSRGWYAVTLHGGMKESDYEANKVAFNTDDKCRIIVCTPSANAGLNLHEWFRGKNGAGLLHVVNLDCAWTPDIMTQRLGRADRIGFEGEGIIPYFLTSVCSDGENTIDKRMADRVRARGMSSDAITGTDFGKLFTMKSKSDFMALLRD